MTDTSIDQLEVQFHLVHDCIRGCVYAASIQKCQPKGGAWLSICDMCYSEAVIAWNAIFGTNSQKAHWKHMVCNLPKPSNSKIKPFGKDMITDHLQISMKEWEAYHKSMLEFRNIRLAHFNHNTIIKSFPNITWAMESAYLYRHWLLLLLKECKKEGQEIKITDTSGKEMVALFEKQILEILK